MLPLQIGVHHANHRFIIRHIPQYHGQQLHAKRFTRRQSSVSRDQFIATVLFPRDSGGQHTVFSDALLDALHLFAVQHLERMVWKLRDLRNGNLPYTLQLILLPLFFRLKEIIDTRRL